MIEHFLLTLLGRFVWWHLERLMRKRTGFRQDVCIICEDVLAPALLKAKGGGMCPHCYRGLSEAFPA